VDKIKAPAIVPIDIEVRSPSSHGHAHDTGYDINNTTYHHNPAAITLTLRTIESRILCSILVGKENAEIAKEMGIDETAVKEHIKSLLRRVRKIKKDSATACGTATK